MSASDDEAWTWETTRDGSPTLRSLVHGQASHHDVGALTEATRKYAAPTCAHHEGLASLRVLDACFGAGLNTWALADRWKRPLAVTGIECDPHPVRNATAYASFFPGLASALVTCAERAEWGSDSDGFTGRVHLSPLQDLANPGSDLFQRVRVKAPFDAIFHDPFSPEVAPELWTLEIFQTYAALLAPGGILVTYSSARCVMAAMDRAGFRLGFGEAIGRNRGGLVSFPRSRSVESSSGDPGDALGHEQGIDPHGEPFLLADAAGEPWGTRASTENVVAARLRRIREKAQVVSGPFRPDFTTLRIRPISNHPSGPGAPAARIEFQGRDRRPRGSFVLIDPTLPRSFQRSGDILRFRSLDEAEVRTALRHLHAARLLESAFPILPPPEKKKAP